jgi:hypothetical protein
MRDEALDKDTRLKAAALLHDRGWGRPAVVVDAEVSHRFVVAPNTLAIDTWIKTKGQGERNDWFQRQQARDANARAQASTRVQPPLELTANDIPETEAAPASAPSGNGGEAAPTEHAPIERRKLN